MVRVSRWSLMLMLLASASVASAWQPIPGPPPPPPPKNDGKMVRASHILVKADKETKAEATATMLAIKKRIETEVADEFAKLPDERKTDKERARILAEAFGRHAAKESICPSKTQRGDIGWFQRHGVVAESFSKAAFELKTFHLSEPVYTEFGMHLILVTDRKTVVLKDGKYIPLDQLPGR